MKHRRSIPTFLFLFHLLLVMGLLGYGGFRGHANAQNRSKFSETRSDSEAKTSSTPKRSSRTDAPGAQRLVLAFYNTENFFDTLPSPDSKHDPYTPQGTYRWNDARYRQKISHIARVLDTLKADIVGLAEIENETVLRDLVSQLHTSYNYLIRPGSDPRGIQVALLYRGSQFFPLHSFQIRGPGLTRPILGVRGRLQGDTITLLVAHLPSLLNRNSWRRAAAQTLQNHLQALLHRDPHAKIILMGDWNMTPRSALARKRLGVKPWPETSSPESTAEARHASRPETLLTPFTTLETRGEGSYVYRDRRYIYDYFLFNTNWTDPCGWRFRGACGVFAPDFLLHSTGPRQGYPYRTFERGNYLGGFSDHLPVWLILEK